MNGFLNILSAALIAVFLQNSILERALGANVLIYASRKKEHVIGFFVAITYTTTISSPLVWLLDNYLGNNPYYHLIMPLLYIQQCYIQKLLVATGHTMRCIFILRTNTIIRISQSTVALNSIL